MKFYSTNRGENSPAQEVDLREAVMNGLAPDGGLYMPITIPHLGDDFWKQSGKMSFRDIAFEMGKSFFVPDVPEGVLKNMIREAFNFEVPLVRLDRNVYVYELSHGPTCAFKDFAARFMARLFAFLFETSRQKMTILVATSGDTGSAVAHGFLNVPGIDVVILYPSGKVSPLQEKQLTGMGGNVTACEVQGSFDDCQKLVKQAFSDLELRGATALASANSINIARLLPQTFYYGYLASRFSPVDEPLIVSVPSGNFGNLTAGIIAKHMGAPISKFVASTNLNDEVPLYLQTGHFEARATIPTISNAMDVGNPSNFSRMLELYDHDVNKMRRDISGMSFSDEQTRDAISKVFETHHYIMDPHGATAYLGLMEYLPCASAHLSFGDSVGVFLETAHPAKFSEEVEKVIGQPVPIPTRLSDYLNRKKTATLLPNSFQNLKIFLMKRYLS